MGGAATKIDTKYEKDRSQLRRALILSFIDNAENRDIVNQIESLKVYSKQYFLFHKGTINYF